MTGERGIGKSSLASFIRFLALKKEGFLGIHVFLGGVNSLDEMVRRVFDELLKSSVQQSWFDRIKGLFGTSIEQIGLFGVSVGFSPRQRDLRQLVGKFPEAVANLCRDLKQDRKGLLIALDDINGLAETDEFANWYKSLVDQVATHFDKSFPVTIMLIGLPEKREKLSEFQPSLLRVFDVVDIQKLPDDEVRGFLEKSFESINIEVEKQAMDTMVHYSSGLPILMHEIGDATLWFDDDGKINASDAETGVLEAADRIGKKYLDPKVYRAMRSERYRSILRKLPRISLSPWFTRKAVKEQLTAQELKVFDNFLRKMREQGIIEQYPDGGKGAYRFVNEVYPVYIMMESSRAKKTRS